MKFAIHGRPINDNALIHIKRLLDFLNKKEAKVQIFTPFNNFLEKKGFSLGYKTYSKREELEDPDFVLSLGGDGTLLEAVTYIGEKEIPILGINMGRLG